MTDSHNTAHPNLEDLGDYLQGLAQVLLQRDAQRQAHELKLAEIARLAAQEDADRAAKQQADKVQAERAAALEALQLERARSAHLIDQVPSVAAELDAIIASADQLDPQRLLPEVRKELQQLPSLIESLSTLTSGGLPHSDAVALHPTGLFQIGASVSSLQATLARVPKRGVGRFVKIGEDGEHLPVFALKWVAVLDTAENLIWERKTEGGTHSEHRRFTNHGKDQPGDSGQYVVQVNRERLAGNSDWRMPTVDELEALYAATDRSDWGLATTDCYWSSSASSDGRAWLVGLSTCNRTDGGRNDQYPVRLVRAAQ